MERIPTRLIIEVEILILLTFKKVHSSTIYITFISRLVREVQSRNEQYQYFKWSSGVKVDYKG